MPLRFKISSKSLHRPMRGSVNVDLSAQFLSAISAARQSYERDGFAIIPNAFQPEEIRRLRAASLISLTQINDIAKIYRHAPFEATNKGGFKSPALLFWARLVNREIADFSDDPRLRAVVQALLGDSVKQLNNQFYYRLPGDGDEFSWHQDIMFRSPLTDYPEIVQEDGYLQTAILVDDFSGTNAPLTFISGSHKFGNLELQKGNDPKILRSASSIELPKTLASLPQTNLIASAGSIVIWSSLAVHRSWPNHSDSSRFYLMNGFARARNSKPWPWYLKDGAMPELDPEMIP